MRKCPTCKQPVEYKENPWRPFCSERCKLIDFGRWADEEYRVPGRRINPHELPEPPRSDQPDEDESSH